MYQPWKNLELWPIQRAEKILTQFVTIGSSLVYLMWKIMVVTRRCLQTPLGKIHIPFPSFFFFFFRRILWSGKLKETIHNRDNALKGQNKWKVLSGNGAKGKRNSVYQQWNEWVLCVSVFLIMENVEGVNWSCLISGFDFSNFYF